MLSQAKGSVSFSQIATNLKFPARSQGVVFDIVDGAVLEDYLDAISKVTAPSNVLFASRITQNRFSFFVTSPALVEELTREGKNAIKVLGKKVELRPYVARLKRVLFSNVMPFIPDHVITDKLKTFGVTIKTSLTPVHVGTEKKAWSHLLSYRRQMFFTEEDLEKIPPDFTVDYEGISYHIYSSKDKMKCFICKTEGHTSKFCRVNKKQQEQRVNKDGGPSLESRLNVASPVGKLPSVSPNSKNLVDSCSPTGATTIHLSTNIDNFTQQNTLQDDQLTEDQPLVATFTTNENKNIEDKIISDTIVDIKNKQQEQDACHDTSPTVKRPLSTDSSEDTHLSVLKKPAFSTSPQETSHVSLETDTLMIDKKFLIDDISEPKIIKTLERMFPEEKDRKYFDTLWNQLIDVGNIIDAGPQISVSYFKFLEFLVKSLNVHNIAPLAARIGVTLDELRPLICLALQEAGKNKDNDRCISDNLISRMKRIKKKIEESAIEIK